jgi:protein-disulfide isomerase
VQTVDRPATGSHSGAQPSFDQTGLIDLLNSFYIFGTPNFDLAAVMNWESGMSRRDESRRKAKRRLARVAREAEKERERNRRPRWLRSVPLLLILGIIAAFGISRFAGSSDASVDRTQIDREVGRLLAGVPQAGSTLGSPRAPITVQMFADLECPTVKRFVEAYLPSLVDRWVRDGTVKIEYRSLKTDTADEHTFFMQDVAALSAGLQGKMWNFALTFLREQGQEFSGYATNEFVTGIAAQISGLDLTSWRGKLEDPLLFVQVAHGMQKAQARAFHSTPSFVIQPSERAAHLVGPVRTNSLESQVKASFERTIESLREETSIDVPVIEADSEDR